MTEVTSLYSVGLVEDLKKSGLTPQDIKARMLGPAEQAATKTPMGMSGYVIPYYDMYGSPMAFYRVRLFDADIKYLQTIETPNHVYFPPGFRDLIGTAKYLVVTEGEKKAAKAVKDGILCCALSGVDSWRSRTLVIPKDSQVSQKSNGQIAVKLPQGGQLAEVMDNVATGLPELIKFTIQRDLPIIIAFDSDVDDDTGRVHVGFDVQRAAAQLGFELRHRGVKVTNIRQVVLGAHVPSLAGVSDKLGLDDYLMNPNLGLSAWKSEVGACLRKRTAFPRHPNPREFVNKKLQRTQMSRSEMVALSMSVLTDLDARGIRLLAPDSDELYYFSYETKELIPVKFLKDMEFGRTAFGRFLYQKYSIGASDQRIVGWLASMFPGEDPVAEVYPERVLTWRGDALYFQINKGAMARVTKEGIAVLDNGEDNVLFEAEQVLDIPTQTFKNAVALVESQPWENWWFDVLKQTRVSEEQFGDQHKRLLSLLYYVSPFFYRWRGTQLPVEITTGEAGSGKSTLYELRLLTTTGIPKLRNAPSDLKDWNASLMSTGALHVTDNVQMTDQNLRQRLSDEICRLVTEANPTIEQRKLYSDATVFKIPVKTVFGITAIRQPFTNVDIIQRSIVTNLDKGTDAQLKYDARWKEHQIELRGGRANWLAHQLLMVRKILQLVDANWDARYQATYRLINVEQLLMLCARTLGWDPTWIPKHLEGSRDAAAADTDWTLEGLVAYATRARNGFGESDNLYNARFTCGMVADWAEQEDEFKKCTILTSPRNLARYMDQHKHTVSTVARIVPAETLGGKQQYKFLPAT